MPTGISFLSAAYTRLSLLAGWRRHPPERRQHRHRRSVQGRQTLRQTIPTTINSARTTDITHAIARRGYRAHGKAYVTSSAVQGQASFPSHPRPVGQSDYADTPLAASPMGSLGIIERTQASCLRRSRHCASRSGFKVRTIRPAAERPGWSLDMGRQCTSAEMADDLPIACHSMYDTD